MLKEFVYLTIVAMEMGKKETISVIIATVAKRKIYFIKTRIFYTGTTFDKIELTGKVQGDKKCCNLKKAHFQ